MIDLKQANQFERMWNQTEEEVWTIFRLEKSQA